MVEKPPLRFLALKLFAEDFGDLVSVRAEITPFERSLIEGTYELLWLDMFDGSARMSWAQTLRAGFRLVDNGALKEPQLVWESYTRIVNEIVPALQRSYEKRRIVKQKKIDDDALIEGHLSTYKSIYEGLLPLILAPVVYAFGLANDPGEKAFLPRQDGRISLVAIKKMEKWVRPPQNRLALRLNNHIRNAFSHDYYRILDHGRVVVHDVNPSTGKTVWGPETWTIQQLSELCDQVWLNSLAIVCALALFGLNCRKVAIARGWGEPTTSPVVRERDFKRILDGFSDEASFDVKECSRSNQELRFRLAIRMDGIDQDEVVYLGGETGARRFKISVKHIETRIVEQVARLLQRILQYLDEVQMIHIEVSTSSGEQLGEIRTTKAVISQLRGPRTQDISDARIQFERDTLGEKTMPVRTENPPIEI